MRAALEVLEPLYTGENALEPERVSEKLHQNTFWQGRGGAITHAISGIDIALWDILGKATGQPVGRLLGRHVPGAGPALRVLAHAGAGTALGAPRLAQGAGIPGVQDGLGTVRSGERRLDEAIVRPPGRQSGTEAMLAVDAGGSDAFWPNGYKWALRTARMLAAYGVAWFEEPLEPDALDDFVALRRGAPVPISGGEVLTRRQSFQPWLRAGAFDIVQPDVTKVGGISEERRIGWMAAGERRPHDPARLEHRRRPRRRPAARLAPSRDRPRRVHHRLRLRGRDHRRRLEARRRGHAPDPRRAGTGPGVGRGRRRRVLWRMRRALDDDGGVERDT